MAQNAPKNIGWLIHTARTNQDALGAIRHWSHLTVAFDGDDVWVKGFTHEQIESAEVKSIPFIKRYYYHSGMLFPLHSQLPEQPEPSLLWTPIARGLVVKLPDFNHNFFGIQQTVSMQLIASDEEQQPAAAMLPMETLAQYADTAPAIRLRNLAWTILNGTFAFVVGRPMLPLQGETYWRSGNFFLPAGLKFELDVLAEAANRKINAANENYVIWEADGTCCLIPKSRMENLSIGSVRLSRLNHLSAPTAS